jgi:AraC family transcriptional regulator
MHVRETAESIGRRFHGPSAQTVIARARPARIPILVSHVVSNLKGPEMTLPPPVESAYAIHVHHRPLSTAEAWIDGKHVIVPPIESDGICVFDLRKSPVALIRESLDFTRFSITQAALDDLAYERGQSGGTHLRIPTLGHRDRVIRSLALALINRTEMFGPETDSFFADWVGLAFHAHIADTYGELRQAGINQGRMAPWRLREACEWMMERLDSPLSIAEVAAQVDMASGYFARAFRKSTGQPPHQWLMRQRVDRAKTLLRTPNLALVEIASMCGFTDQSHLTRIFRRLEGMTPGRWRRQFSD